MAAVYILVAIAAGVFLPLQAGVNTRLAQFVGGPIRASLISFLVGALLLAVITAIAYRGGTHRLGAAPWWAWVGGALGTVYVTAAIVVAPRMGVGPFFGVLVAAQLVATVVIDRFGWLGYAQREVTPLRALGVAMLVGGALLVRLA
jgi:transporter family-2 protein